MLLASSLLMTSCVAKGYGTQESKEAMTGDKNKLSTQQEQALQTARSLVRLMIERDTEGMRAILADSMYLKHITGYRQPREEWLEEVRSESMKYYSAKEEYARTLLLDEATVQVSMAHQLDARIWGSRRVWPLKQVMTLAKRGDRWIIISSEASM